MAQSVPLIWRLLRSISAQGVASRWILILIRRMIKNWWVLLWLLSGCVAEQRAHGGYQGVVELEERRLGFELGGRLLQVTVREGDHVEPGQLLARLDDSLEQLRLAVHVREQDLAQHQYESVVAPARPDELSVLRARAQAARAAEQQSRDNLERERGLYEGGATPRALVEDLERQLEYRTAQRQEIEYQLALLRQGARDEERASAQARADVSAASLSAAQQQLVRYNLRALRAGEVSEVYAREGEVLAAGAPVVAVTDPRRPYADVFVPQAQLAPFIPGRAVRVRVDALERPLDGRVEFVATRSEFTPRYLFSEQERPHLVVRVRVRIEAPQRQLHAGVPAFVELAPTERDERAASAEER